VFDQAIPCGVQCERSLSGTRLLDHGMPAPGKYAGTSKGG